jgi:RNA polymerase sigma factor (sigma-70 family)
LFTEPSSEHAHRAHATNAVSPRRRSAPSRPSRRRGVAWESDSELVAQILAGSRVHFEMLYEAYFPRVYRFALKRMRDAAEAEDVTQEVFVTVFRALRSYQGNSSLLVWIFGIARNKVNRRFRGVRPWLESIDPDSLKAVSNEAPADETVQARILLAQCEDAIENRDAAAAAHLPPEAPAPAVDSLDRGGARQERGRDQGEPLSDAPRDRAGRARPRAGAARVARRAPGAARSAGSPPTESAARAVELRLFVPLLPAPHHFQSGGPHQGRGLLGGLERGCGCEARRTEAPSGGQCAASRAATALQRR